MQTAKRIRLIGPPSIERAKREKLYQNFKCSLRSVCKHETDLLEEIEKRVFSISEMSVKASLLFNLLLIRLCETKSVEQWPPLKKNNVFVQCFTQGVEARRRTKNLPELEDVWRNFFSPLNFPQSKRYKYDCTFINYAAKRYQTCFLVSLKTNFVSRQRMAIRHFLGCRNIGRVRLIQNKINGWTRTARQEVVDNPLELEFILEHRRLLGKPNKVNGDFFEENPAVVVRYFYHILKDMEGDATTKIKCGKLFTLAPICKVKRHHVTIDSVGVKSLVQSVSILKNLKKVGFSTLFDIKDRGNRTFDRCIATDGVSCSIRYFRHSTNKKTTRYNEVGSPSKLRGARIIGVDPGSHNVAFCVEVDGGKNILSSKRLTSGDYYTQSGIIRKRKRTQLWSQEPTLKNAQSLLSGNSLKTVNKDTWSSYIGNYISIYNDLWLGKMGKKWARERFRVYCLKNKTLDKFVDGVLGRKKKKSVHVAYGSAQFSSRGRGKRYSAPNSAVLKKFAEKAGPRNFSFVDEYNTSKLCHRCGGDLQIVTGDSGFREVRGLRRCASSNNCSRRGAFVNRDENAAANIGSLILKKKRPLAFTRRHQYTRSFFQLPGPTMELKVGRSVFGKAEMASEHYNPLVGVVNIQH